MSLIRFVLTPVFLAITFLIFYLDYVRNSSVLTSVCVLILSSLALHELFIMYRKQGHIIYEPLAYPCLILAVMEDVFLSILLFFLMLVVKGLILKDRNIKTIGIIFLFYVYISLIFLVFRMESVPTDKLPFVFLFILATNKGHDSFAYLTGKTIGRRKLTRWSPNKTLEGFIGGMIGGTVLGIIAIKYSPLNSLITGIFAPVMLSIIMTLASSIGDIFESMIKRIAKAKDSGDIIPEFGGFLDLLDSFFISVPTLFIFFKLYLG